MTDSKDVYDELRKTTKEAIRAIKEFIKAWNKEDK